MPPQTRSSPPLPLPPLPRPDAESDAGESAESIALALADAKRSPRNSPRARLVFGTCWATPGGPRRSKAKSAKS